MPKPKPKPQPQDQNLHPGQWADLNREFYRADLVILSHSCPIDLSNAGHSRWLR